MGHHIPSLALADLGFSKPGCQNPGIWCAPPHPSAKGRNPFFVTWAFTPSPNKNCVYWHSLPKN